MDLLMWYSREPFPAHEEWREDLARIAETGVRGIVTWVTWAWVEPSPGSYDFADVDLLFDEAQRAGLDVVVTAGPDIFPYWIHREIPDSHMVDHTGRRVASTTPVFNHNGLTPGGCTDHPEVRERSGAFLEALARHLHGRSNLLHWDCWMELMWNTHADGHVCFCDHSVAAFRSWLRDRHGDLDGLNDAWRRRYVSWDDVLPGVRSGRNWTETIAYQQFLTDRMADDVSFRAGRLRAGDPGRHVFAHGVVLSPFMTLSGRSWEQPLSRGNEWEVATRLDGLGASHYPNWFQSQNAEYGVRLESARSAAGEKRYWVSELQTSEARHGFGAMDGVPAKQMERWIWSAYGRGAEGIALFRWSPDVFGREAGGFAITGEDGYAEERLETLARTTRVLRAHGELLDGYAPDPARVGVLFDGLNHQLEWASDGGNHNAAWGFSKMESSLSAGSVLGHLLALERLQVPYDVLEAAHLRALEQYRVILMPWPEIVRPEVAAALARWVADGGTLLVESELDAFDERGFHTRPAQRAFPRALGFAGAGRRPLGDTERIPFALDGVSGELRPATWLEPLLGDGEAVAATDAGTLVLRRSHGAGTVIAVGTHAGYAYGQEAYPDFERFLRAVLAAGDGLPSLTCSVADGERVQWRSGRSGERRLLFVVNGGPAADVTLRGPAELFGGAMQGRDLVAGGDVELAADGQGMTLSLALAENDARVLAF